MSVRSRREKTWTYTGYGQDLDAMQKMGGCIVDTKSRLTLIDLEEINALHAGVSRKWTHQTVGETKKYVGFQYMMIK